MIPLTSSLYMDVEFAEQSTKTYRMDLTTEEHIGGYTDELGAMKQAIFKILNTERYQHIMYSWDYGIELVDLYGQPITYVCPELERRVTEALMQDGRIESVTDFDFKLSRNAVHVSFLVHTIFGTVEAERAVNF